jgi:hypothetical protein
MASNSYRYRGVELIQPLWRYAIGGAVLAFIPFLANMVFGAAAASFFISTGLSNVFYVINLLGAFVTLAIAATSYQLFTNSNIDISALAALNTLFGGFIIGIAGGLAVRYFTIKKLLLPEETKRFKTVQPTKNVWLTVAVLLFMAMAVFPPSGALFAVSDYQNVTTYGETNIPGPDKLAASSLLTGYPAGWSNVLNEQFDAGSSIPNWEKTAWSSRSGCYIGSNALSVQNGYLTLPLQGSTDGYGSGSPECHYWTALRGTGYPIDLNKPFNFTTRVYAQNHNTFALGTFGLLPNNPTTDASCGANGMACLTHSASCGGGTSGEAFLTLTAGTNTYTVTGAQSCGGCWTYWSCGSYYLVNVEGDGLNTIKIRSKPESQQSWNELAFSRLSLLGNENFVYPYLLEDSYRQSQNQILLDYMKMDQFNSWCYPGKSVVNGSKVYTCLNGGQSISVATCKYGQTAGGCVIPNDFTISVEQTAFTEYETTDILVPVTLTYESKNTPVAGSNVEIRLGNYSASGTTAANGGYAARFPNVPAGSYQLTVTATEPVYNIPKTYTASVDVRLTKVKINVPTTSVTVTRGDPVKVTAQIAREDNVAVVGTLISGTLTSGGKSYQAVAITSEGNSKATLNFNDVNDTGSYTFTASFLRPLTGETISVTSGVAVTILPKYQVDFDSNTILYQNQAAKVGLTVRDEYNAIVPIVLQQSDISVTLNGKSITAALTIKGSGLFDLAFTPTETGPVNVTVLLPMGRSATWTAQVALPNLKVLTNIQPETSAGQTAVEAYIRDQNNALVEADSVQLSIESPLGKVTNAQMIRASQGVYGSSYNFNETGRYVMNITVERAGFGTVTDSSYTDVGVTTTGAGGLTILGGALNVVYAVAGIVVIIIIWQLVSRMRKKKGRR